MKKNWQIKVFILTVAVTLIACQAVMGPVDDDITISGLPTREAVVDGAEMPNTAPPSTEAGNAGESGNPTESCFDGESYHPESELCYRDDGSAEPLFLAMMAGVTDYSDEDFADAEEVGEEENLVKYTITGDEISAPEYEDVSAELKPLQEDGETHERVWDFFSAIIPQERRDFVSDYLVFTDGKNGTLAAVEQTQADPYAWMVEIDPEDTTDMQDFTFTLIHEYGHLLTLNSEQVKVDETVFYNPEDDDAYFDAEDNCATYFTGEGCANPSSYFYLFYDEFWADTYNEWLDIEMIEDDDAYYDALDEFWAGREDEFITEYAMTNPGEDIAESWAVFVTHPKPTGNRIADEKVLFFYQFPELVELRSEIIARAYSRLIRVQ